MQGEIWESILCRENRVHHIFSTSQQGNVSASLLTQGDQEHSCQPLGKALEEKKGWVGSGIHHRKKMPVLNYREYCFPSIFFKDLH